MGNNWWDEPDSLPHRAGQNIVNLLFRVSEDNARRNAYVHRGCACNGCGLIPIRGIRYRCANCADFDLCETCESQGLHIKTHIFYKVRIPAPPFGPRQSQPVWYPGDPENCLKSLRKPVMAQLSKETGFERPELEAFWEQWTFLANTEWREDPLELGLAMDRKTFERCLVPSGGYRHTAPNLIHDRMFAFYDTNNDDLIGFAEFLHGLAYRKRKDKLKRIFDGYDVDGDGLVSRRDFLRIFRAYYVLYKQMHQDIIEGIDDQVLSSADVHQLVNSRQPLSSFFGREGRVPPARDGRALDGKIRANGEVFVDNSVHGVVADDKPDHVDRNDILGRLFDEYDPRYLRGLLHPPTSVDQLPALLSGETNENDDLFVDQGASEEHTNGHFFDSILQAEPSSPDVDNVAGEGQVPRDDTGGQITSRPARNRSSLGGDPSTPSAASDIQRAVLAVQRASAVLAVQRAVEGQHGDPDRQWGVAMDAHSEPRITLAERSRMVAQSKRSQAEARKKLFDRWRRRQFYLDEEEGAVAPEDWDEDEDVLAHYPNGNGESSKAAQQPHMLSPRSRSNSKVRFAEDTDDYETRSNPSTSSRSVPERWGGMEIPDAERDAGKEILYQVTQQSFNELLDTLFKAKEDLAIAAAETRDVRAQHRSLFEDINLKKIDEGEEPWEDPDECLETLRSKSVHELLASSGYTIDVQVEAEQPEEERPDKENRPEEEEESEDELRDMMREISMRPGELSLAHRQRNLEEATASGQADVHTHSNGTQHRDPTMPQFRPNSEHDAHVPADTNSSSGRAAPATEADENHIPSASKGKSKEPSPKKAPSTPITPDTLIKWKRLDVAEEEAKARGGWGKLTYAEFEEIYQAASLQDNRLDYMGSWIDFCIP
jgi:Ca2+-binding EF-hand superfamily protein